MCVISKVFSSLVEDSNQTSYALDVCRAPIYFVTHSFIQQAIVKGPLYESAVLARHSKQ